MDTKGMRSSIRKALLALGIYNIHKEKRYRDKTKYNRKQKHKGNE